MFSMGDMDISGAAALMISGLAIFIAIAAMLLVFLRRENIHTRQEAERAMAAARERHEKQLSDKRVRIRDLEMELEKSRQNNTDLEARAAALQARMEEQQKQNEYINSRMEEKFRLLAEEVLSSQGEKFGLQNRQLVGDLLKPLAEKISEFQKMSHEGSARLAEQMKALARDSMRMSEEANNLTRALKGNSQAQGAWGEMVLASILEKSGLREGEQYLKQQSHRSRSGSLVRTDVEILFPNNDRLVIDSKVSLNAFEAYTNCQDEEKKQEFLREHVNSLRSHIKTLGEKDYQVHSGSGLNYVMMFVPIEGAFSAAFEARPDLIDQAISKNVYITTPTTLMVALRTVANVWDTENRNKNAQEIASRAGRLYDKVCSFLASMDRMEKSLAAAQKNFDEAKGQLARGPGNVIRQVEQLQELGAKNSKQMPPGWNGEQEQGPDGGSKTGRLEGSGEKPAEIEQVPDFLPATDRVPAKK